MYLITLSKKKKNNKKCDDFTYNLFKNRTLFLDVHRDL